ncbi:nitrilase-related carbon-nitrogen hydrolase [Lysinibacillus sp. BW-2-10]|uniref:nitrilase-related carbon-nitrogen hydrolase n=1 Tax=Lysinibacillus sp. BW-2-10 TaxID=2590030 RepID=UPI001180649F|nr:nitrilase-related carbon-nitrogen hydrolase [Lysinibacillus sp. BW-2-10]TSI08660.1 nitrilase [Lysinibacillus sp. BW-2-10]
MKVAAIQMRTISGQIEKNQKNGEKFVLDAIHKGAQLIVLPELWSTGYHLSKESFMKLQPKTKEIVERFCDMAKKYEVVLVVPFIDKQDADLFIALAVIEKTGEVLQVYHKSFLWNKEKLYFQPGELRFEPIQTSVGKLGTLICYDMEFPETSRILALAGAELIIIPSIFSFSSEKRWDVQLPARAVDNTVFVLGVNAVGENSFGKSKLIHPKGAIVREAARLKEEILLCDINLQDIKQVRKNIPYLHDLDPVLYPHHMK